MYRVQMMKADHFHLTDRSTAVRISSNRRFCHLIIALSLAVRSYGIETGEASFELLDSDLFKVSLLTARAEGAVDGWELETTLSRTEYDIDFRPAPFDLLGREVHVNRNTHSFSFIATKTLEDSLSLIMGLGLRDGFPNYRAVWLDTYFEQHFAPLEGVPGHELYQPFEASAASFNVGLKWEYLPANGIATISLARIQDNVSPGYEIDFGGIARSERVLATSSISLTSENVLSQRLRSRVALSASETSAREVRYTGEVALNAALGERFICRNKSGALTENPQFDAYFYGTAFEHSVSDVLSLSINARRYSDTGVVGNALLFTTAAPGLRNDCLGIGLRYAGESWSAKLNAKHSHSNFEPTNANTDFFRNLYVDADWLTLQLAFAKRF
ncbi:hypothetical protein [Pelagicoccus sp. SDUM812002]|uniref:hypothetical protein n=1 Tax=Pelagicoccus sp. SDUM812002 TaxID=3041266 RepID=UPI00280C6BE4|nr:hypothetical protein [Pelagicoccus sp. SDUM812002]MDQ8184365.1 hypothetical protein [Pelagicoccus sp. SDUM812002]